MKRYMLTQPAFIAATLLAVGSVITDTDLGSFKDPKSGKTVPVAPPESAIEIAEDGRPIDGADNDIFQTLLADINPQAALAVGPVGIGAIRSQGAPSQPGGGAQFAENSLRSAPVDTTGEAEAPRRRSRSDVTAEAAALAAVDAGASGQGSGSGSSGS